jgi:hypothetical protein
MLKEFLVEQPDVDGEESTSEGLQPFDVEANVKLLEALGDCNDPEEVDKVVSKVADRRKWSFHKDLLLDYLTDDGDTMTLEGRLLVGIVARQILLRSKAENPPNKSVAQELFVKLKGDSDKSNSIALYVTAKWPKQFFQEIQADLPSQPDNDLRIQILKVGFGFVENSFVIDTAKKVDLLKSRNLPWADFSQKVYQWASENSHKGFNRIMEAAEKTKNHLQNIGAAFSATDPSQSTNTGNKNNKEEHVLKDEEELKRIEAKKSEERRAAMRSQMRRGSNSAVATTPATVFSKSTFEEYPGKSAAATATATPGISYQSSSTASRDHDTPSYPGGSTAYTATAPVVGVQDHKATSQPRWGDNRRQDQNQDPQSQTAGMRPPIHDASSRQFGLDRQQDAAQQPFFHDNNARNFVPKNTYPKRGYEELRAQRPSLQDDGGAMFVANIGQGTMAQSQLARREERVAHRPPLNDGDGRTAYYGVDNTYADQPFDNTLADSQQQGAVSGYGSQYEQTAYGRPPIPPSTHANPPQSTSYFRQDDSIKRPRGGDTYQRNTRQRSESPSFGGGRGRGRGMDMTKPAWMTESTGPNGAGPTGALSNDFVGPSSNSNGPAFSETGAFGGEGRGRGRHQTAPAWMTRDQPDPSIGSGPPPLGNSQLPPPPSGGGRGVHQTQPAWMTQQQQQQQHQDGPTGRPEDALGSAGGGAGRGRGRGLTLPAWVTQQQQQQ